VHKVSEAPQSAGALSLSQVPASNGQYTRNFTLNPGTNWTVLPASFQ